MVGRKYSSEALRDQRNSAAAQNSLGAWVSSRAQENTGGLTRNRYDRLGEMGV